MRVTVVDLEVTGTDRHVLHDVVERLPVDRRSVDQQVAVLDPSLLVVPRRRVRRHGDPDSLSELAVKVDIGVGVVGAVSDANKLVGVGCNGRSSARYESRSSGVAVIEALELLGESGAPLQLEAVISNRFILWRFEHVDPALVFGSIVLDLDFWRHRHEGAFLRFLDASDLLQRIELCGVWQRDYDRQDFNRRRVYGCRHTDRASDGSLVCSLGARARRNCNHCERSS